MIKAVLFDLDGTLLDTSKTIHAVLNKSLEKFSLPPVSLEKTLTFVGDGAKKLVERAVPNRDAELINKVHRAFSEYYAEDKNLLTAPYEGEIQTLNELQSRGIKLAIITNKPQKATENVCKTFFDSVKFDFIAGDSGVFPLKPDPSLTLDIIDKLNLKKDECVFVGDGEADVKTARNAGIKCISVLWGFRSRKALESAGADIFVNSYGELALTVSGL